MEEQLWIHRDSLEEAANSEHTDIKDLGLMHKHQPNQPVKEVSQICELFGIIGEKENRRGKKNGTVATG